MAKAGYIWDGSAWVQIVTPDAINGEGVPSGGTTGQFLKKNGSTDYDDSWSDLPAASTSSAGVVQLTDSISSTSITTAATANSVKTLSDASIPKTIVDAKGDLIVATAADTVTRLAAGTNGHILTADSTAAEGVEWSPEGGLVYGSGYYYSYLPTANTTFLMVKDVVYLVPFYVPTTTTFTRIAIRTSGTAGSSGSVIRLGIYDSDSNSLPNNRVVDGGTVPGTTTGSRSVTISQSLSKGLYWIAAASQVATITQPTSQRIVQSSGSPFVPQGTVSADDAGAPNINVGYSITGVSGALPSTASGYAVVTTVPAIYLGV